MAASKVEARLVINIIPVNAYSALGSAVRNNFDKGFLRNLYALGPPKPPIASKGRSECNHVIDDVVASTLDAVSLYKIRITLL